jgi:hypothetical protein
MPERAHALGLVRSARSEITVRPPQLELEDRRPDPLDSTTEPREIGLPGREGLPGFPPLEMPAYLRCHEGRKLPLELELDCHIERLTERVLGPLEVLEAERCGREDPESLRPYLGGPVFRDAPERAARALERRVVLAEVQVERREILQSRLEEPRGPELLGERDVGGEYLPGASELPLEMEDLAQVRAGDEDPLLVANLLEDVERGLGRPPRRGELSLLEVDARDVVETDRQPCRRRPARAPRSTSEGIDTFLFRVP